MFIKMTHHTCYPPRQAACHLASVSSKRRHLNRIRSFRDVETRTSSLGADRHILQRLMQHLLRFRPLPGWILNHWRWRPSQIDLSLILLDLAVVTTRNLPDFGGVGADLEPDAARVVVLWIWNEWIMVGFSIFSWIFFVCVYVCVR